PASCRALSRMCPGHTWMWRAPPGAPAQQRVPRVGQCRYWFSIYFNKNNCEQAMTQVDFYILPDSQAEARWQFACRLIEKAHRLGHRILVATDSSEDAQHLDQLL